jgi:hypothetical protein
MMGKSEASSFPVVAVKNFIPSKNRFGRLNIAFTVISVLAVLTLPLYKTTSCDNLRLHFGSIDFPHWMNREHAR